MKIFYKIYQKVIHFGKNVLPKTLLLSSLLALPLAGLSKDPTFNFSIESQSLDAALKEFGLVADKQVMYPDSMVKDLMVNPVSGNYTAEQALEEMLRGSGLGFEKTGSGVLLLKKQVKRGRQPERDRARSSVIEEVFVTATKRTESMQDVPISVSAFGAAQLEAMGADNVWDLATAAPNVSFMGGIGSGAWADISIRGISSLARNAGQEANLGVYVDGVLLGRPAAFNSELADVERVEILRGPQGTLFGKNTIAGVLNLTTRKPGEEVESLVEVGAGNYNLFKVKGYVSGPLGDGFFGKISASVTKREGYIEDVVYDRDLEDINIQGARVQLRALPTDRLELNFKADVTRERSAPNNAEKLEGLGAEFSPGPYTTAKNDPSILNRDLWGVSLTADYDFGEGYTLTSISAYRKTKYRMISDEDASPIDWYSFDHGDNASQFTQELRIQSPTWSNVDFVGGLYYFYQDIETERLILAGVDFPVDGAVVNSGSTQTDAVAAFGSLNYHLTDRLGFNVGLRYTHEKKELDYAQEGLPAIGVPNIFPFKDEYSEGAFSGSLGVNYDWTDDLMTYLTVSSGFKSGGWNMDIISSENIGFDPEFVVNYEAGFKSSLFENRLRLNGSAFYMDYKDKQVSSIVVTSIEITNAAAADIQGVELELMARPTTNLDLTVNVGYLDAEYGDYQNCVGFAGVENCSGNRLRLAPRWSYMAAVDYRYPLGAGGELVLRGEYSYRDEQFYSPINDPLEFEPSYRLIGGRIGYVSESGNWEVFAWGKNLNNEVYAGQRYVLVAAGGNFAAFNEPRTYGVTARLRY